MDMPERVFLGHNTREYIGVDGDHIFTLLSAESNQFNIYADGGESDGRQDISKLIRLFQSWSMI